MKQLAKTMTDREKGKLPNTSEVNSKQAMAISLRSAKQLDRPKVVEKPIRDKGKNVKDPNPKEKVVHKKVPFN